MSCLTSSATSLLLPPSPLSPLSPLLLPFPLSSPPSLSLGVCERGEHSQGAGSGSGEGGLTAALCQSQTGRGSDQEPAAERAGALGQAGAEVPGPRPAPGRGPQEGQAGRARETPSERSLCHKAHKVSFRAHSGLIQGSFRSHSGLIQGSFRAHSGLIQGSFRANRHLSNAHLSFFISLYQISAAV